MPYWRLSGFYFFYFAALGALVPYWGLYLQDRGFAPVEIGQLMAILMATKILAPNVWGWLADRSGQRLPIVRLASLLAALIFGGIFLVRGFWGIALVMALFSFFWNATLPQIEAATFNYLGLRVARYTSIRLWGSIGFVISVATLGPLVGSLGIGLVPVTLLILFLILWVSSLLVPEGPPHPHHAEPVSFSRLLGRGEILAFLGVCLLMQVSHSNYYTFFSIYLKASGYQGGTIGALWAWGVVAEVLVYLVMAQILERFGARRVLLASLGLASVRWLLIGHFVGNPLILIGAQSLHAATFGTFHAAAIHLVHHYFPGRVQGRGQALYASLSFGGGGAIGSLLGGYLWEEMGAVVTFSVAAAIAALGWLVAWQWVDQQRRY